MVNLYTLPTYVVVLFIGVILCLFLANSVLYYYLMPQAQFRQLGRKCLEGSSLLLLMAVATILYESLHGQPEWYRLRRNDGFLALQHRPGRDGRCCVLDP